EPGHIPELGRAYRREVLWMGEQHGPLVANPLVKVDRAFCRLRSEIGRDGAQPKGYCILLVTSNRHDFLPGYCFAHYSVSISQLHIFLRCVSNRTAPRVQLDSVSAAGCAQKTDK